MATLRSSWPFIALAAGVVLAAGAQAQDSVTPPAPVAPLPAAPAAPAAPIPGVPAADVPPEEPTPAVAKPDKTDTTVAAGNTVDEDDKPEAPVELEKRPRFASAILQATDKVTAETLRFEAKVGESLRYKGLIVTLRTCETTAGNEEPFDSIANVDVLSQPQGMAGGTPAPARSVYRGWMFANSPSLHAFEHPLYDLWLISCRTSAPVGAPAAAPPPRRVPASTPKAAKPDAAAGDAPKPAPAKPAKPAKPKPPAADDAPASSKT